MQRGHGHLFAERICGVVRIIANVAVLTAISAGMLAGVGAPATAMVVDRPGEAALVAGTTGSSSGSAGPALNALLCALLGGVTGSTETTPPQCHLPTA